MRALTQHGSAPVPSRRTISRMVRRHHQEGKAHGARAAMLTEPGVTSVTIPPKLSTVHVCCSSPAPDPHWTAWNVYPAFDEDGTRAPRGVSVAENSACGFCTRHQHDERTSIRVWCGHGGAPACAITPGHAPDGQQCCNPPGGKKRQKPLRGYFRPLTTGGLISVRRRRR